MHGKNKTRNYFHAWNSDIQT